MRHNWHVFIMSSEPQLFQGWYAHGKIKYRRSYLNGKLEGEHRGWYSNGKSELQEFYINGKREGKSILWYENGQLAQQDFYRNGKLEEESKRWRDDGRPWDILTYRSDTRDGEFIYWHENGRIDERGFYRNGFLEGELRSWHDNGTVKRHEFYFRDGRYTRINLKEKLILLNVKRRFHFRKHVNIISSYIISDLSNMICQHISGDWK